MVYFTGLTQLTDPSVANINGAALQALSPLKAIASGSQILLANPLPGQLGNLGYGVIRGPGAKTLNVNVKKNIRISERVTLQIGATANNVTNTPVFNDPDMNINSVTFGRITGTGAAGNRILVLQGRVNF